MPRERCQCQITWLQVQARDLCVPPYDADWTAAIDSHPLLHPIYGQSYLDWILSSADAQDVPRRTILPISAAGSSMRSLRLITRALPLRTIPPQVSASIAFAASPIVPAVAAVMALAALATSLLGTSPPLIAAMSRCRPWPP